METSSTSNGTLIRISQSRLMEFFKLQTEDERHYLLISFTVHELQGCCSASISLSVNYTFVFPSTVKSANKTSCKVMVKTGLASKFWFCY